MHYRRCRWGLVATLALVWAALAAPPAQALIHAQVVDTNCALALVAGSPVLAFDDWDAQQNGQPLGLVYAAAKMPAPTGPPDWQRQRIAKLRVQGAVGGSGARQTVLTHAGALPVLATLDSASDGSERLYDAALWLGFAAPAAQQPAAAWTMYKLLTPGEIDASANLAAASLRDVPVVAWLARLPPLKPGANHDLGLCAAYTTLSKPTQPMDWNIATFRDPVFADRPDNMATGLCAAGAEDLLLCAYGVRTDQSAKTAALRLAWCPLSSGKLQEWRSQEVVVGHNWNPALCVAGGTVYVFYTDSRGLRVAYCTLSKLGQQDGWHTATVYAGKLAGNQAIAAAAVGAKPAVVFCRRTVAGQRYAVDECCAWLDADPARGPRSWNVSRIRAGEGFSPVLAADGERLAVCYQGGNLLDPALIYACTPLGPPRTDQDWMVTVAYGNTSWLPEVHELPDVTPGWHSNLWLILCGAGVAAVLGTGLFWLRRARRRKKETELAAIEQSTKV